MKEVGRPTEEELDRLEELVEQYFVGDSWAVEIRCWDDDDVHLTAYSTIGTNCNEGYPLSVAWHRQNIIYERQSGHCHYENRLRSQTSSQPDRTLNRVEIDW
jgi:hypothetical protein